MTSQVTEGNVSNDRHGGSVQPLSFLRPSAAPPLWPGLSSPSYLVLSRRVGLEPAG